MSILHLPDIAELDRKRKENRDKFEHLVPQSLYSDYLDARQELKLLASKRQAEINSIYQKYEATKKSLFERAGASLEKMGELTGIEVEDLKGLVGGYYVND